jgi:hypothetical protein
LVFNTIPKFYDKEVTMTMKGRFFTVGGITFTDAGPTASATYLFQEYATYAPINKTGLYNPVTGAELELFDGPASPSSPDRLVFVDYNPATGTATARGITAELGSVFGVYIDSSADPGGGKWYSQQARNADQANHVMSFDVNPPIVAELGPYNQIFAFEDLDCAQFCDADFTDMVIGMTDVSAVPIPAAGWLFVSGLLGIVAITRKRGERNSKSAPPGPGCTAVSGAGLES